MMTTTATLVQHSSFSELRALGVMARKEWTIFRRYPTWIFAFLIWPLIFPLGAIFTAQALSGPDQASLPAFAALSGTIDYVAYIVVGLTMYMWLNITLWDVGFQLRNEQMRGTLESNWLCPVWRFSILLGPSLTKLLTSLVFMVVAVVEYGLIFGNWIVGGNLGLVLLIMLLVIPSIYGIGVLFGSLVIRFQEANTMVFLVRGLFMIFTNLITTTLVNVGILALGWWLFGFTITGSVWQAMSVALPMLLALYGFGFAFAAVVLLVRDANMMVDVSDFLVTMLSGSQFPVQALPGFLLPIALALPLTYGFDVVRGLLIQSRTLLPIPYEIAILVLFMAVTVPLGYAIFRSVERRIKRLGTLGMH